MRFNIPELWLRWRVVIIKVVWKQTDHQAAAALTKHRIMNLETAGDKTPRPYLAFNYERRISPDDGVSVNSSCWQRPPPTGRSTPTFTRWRRRRRWRKEGRVNEGGMSRPVGCWWDGWKTAAVTEPESSHLLSHHPPLFFLTLHHLTVHIRETSRLQPITSLFLVT